MRVSLYHDLLNDRENTQTVSQIFNEGRLPNQAVCDVQKCCTLQRLPLISETVEASPKHV